MSCILWPPKTSVLKTLLIFFAYLVVGWSDSLFGPFYSQYQVALQSTTADTSYLVQSSFVGFTLGNLIREFTRIHMMMSQEGLTSKSVTCTVLVQSNCWSIHGAYVCSVLGMAVANLCIPHIHSLQLMCAVFFVNGLAGGTIQAGTYTRPEILIRGAQVAISPL